MSTAAVVGLVGLKLVGMGLCLGVGFWMSRKLTDGVDGLLLVHDRKFMGELSQLSV